MFILGLSNTGPIYITQDTLPILKSVGNNLNFTCYLNSSMPCKQIPEIRTDILAAAAKSLQSCPTLCDPVDGSPPGSPIPGLLQARTLEWDAISFSNA